ncbi:fatty acid oxidation complex subunit alpha FadB [Marinobacterium jannaschii]|uniref:fatty acid oxidation complex subunit alpha FadB n=1 Tax=Marinobacterium jannaschii TaxID=64970 RepID=UPI000481A852|nr:fatty acid oxidation complex subunit alpha FadB [Marinobacterium jannaschii]
MLMEGKAIRVENLGEGVCQLLFDSAQDSVNKFDQHTLQELEQAVSILEQVAELRGVMISSAKQSFIVGADITEFSAAFSQSDEVLAALLTKVNALFNRIEDLPCPTVAAINGLALGGGFELCLAADYRVIAEGAKVGLPEVKLGIYPGWGGTVRLPRLIGIDNANEWICSGVEKRAAEALAEGAVDALVTAELLHSAALDLLGQCACGTFDYRARRSEKQRPVGLTEIEKLMAFESAKGVIGAKAGPHYPAPLAALKVMQQHAAMERQQAQAAETAGFLKVARSEVTDALVGVFLKDQYLKKVARTQAAGCVPVRQAAVLGAGIMGGGIAYQSASKGVPILMKDIAPQALQLGLSEASKLLGGQLKRGRTDPAKMAATLNRITPTLNYGDFAAVDLVVEAVVENPQVKQAVLIEAEQAIAEDTILTSNTSTISISQLARGLKRPQNFCGMHFFNPVHRMPLVEVIRGEKTSDATVARTLAYAQTLGKSAVVVNDCPGFLVNRILFPYFAGFSLLLHDGADFRQVDRVMEAFGWPMGPAYLLDVVGIDTACHGASVMAQGFPDRMGHQGESALERLYSLKRFGQKSGQGFYRYETDHKGKPLKQADPEIDSMLDDVTGQPRAFSDEEIIQRMMIPLCIEAVRCLEEGIVASPAELDMALVYGIGFPPFRGGALHYLDHLGLDQFCQQAGPHAALGALYQPTAKMQAMAAAGKRYFAQGEKS